jgi:hypothetical protein
MRHALLALPILFAGAGPVPAAASQERQTVTNQSGNSAAPRAPRIQKTTQEPFRLGGAALATPRADLAPMPNRGIEAPRDRFSTSYNAPSLEPMILQPDRRTGMTFGREHLRETGPDRPFDNILPGARLRIPIQ